MGGEAAPHFQQPEPPSRSVVVGGAGADDVCFWVAVWLSHTVREKTNYAQRRTLSELRRLEMTIPYFKKHGI